MGFLKNMFQKKKEPHPELNKKDLAKIESAKKKAYLNEKIKQAKQKGFKQAQPKETFGQRLNRASKTFGSQMGQLQDIMGNPSSLGPSKSSTSTKRKSRKTTKTKTKAKRRTSAPKKESFIL